MASTRDRAYLAAMKRGGIVYPETTLAESRRAGIKLSLACALLEQESAGGKNVWGNDRPPNGGTSGWGWRTVTERDYRAYLRRRGSRGRGGMQGVGPCQLTWYEFQDRADGLGGCWKPAINMRVGFAHLASLIREHGYAVGVERYNGVGRREYSRSVRSKAEKWHDVLVEAAQEDDDPSPQKPDEKGEPYPALRDGDRGAKVRKLQRALNRRAKSFDLWDRTDVDGIYGPDTHGLVVEVVYRLGVYSRRIRGGALSAYAHELVIAPHRRNETQVERAKARAKEDAPTGRAPRIVTAREAGIRTSAVFGAVGPETKLTTHYAAGPRARNLSEAISLSRGHDRFHRSKGWGGLSYHYMIPDTGEIVCGRSPSQKGAHVAGQNSNNIGINFFGTTGDRPTRAQIEAAKWLVANAHTERMPRAHRTDRDLRRADIRGHRFWPGQSTGCPGHFTPQNLGLRRTNG